MDKTYLLDGEPVTFTELIRAAETEGYDGEGLCLTSQAAAILRANGHTVAETPAS